MAIILESMFVLVRFSRLATVYPGGEAALRNPETCGCWHDGEIACFASMNDYDLQQIVDQLKGWGLRQGKDFGGPSLPWVEFNPESSELGSAGLRGKPNGLSIGLHNFEDFLLGKIKPKTLRATAVVQRNGMTLLVRDRNKSQFSLPGGQLNRDKYKRIEPALAAAVRELHEELGLYATTATRCQYADLDGSFNRHLVSQLTVDEYAEIRLCSRELAEYTWWDEVEPINIFPHVRGILSMLNPGIEKSQITV